MAQPSFFIMGYNGSTSVVAGKAYTDTDFTLGNVMQMKTHGVRVSISGMDAFDITYDDLGYVVAGATYTFNKDCIIAFGDMTEVV